MPNTSSPEPTELKDLQAIPKWTRRYAQNRTLPFLLSMAISLLVFAAIGVSSCLGGIAFRSGNMILFWIALVGLAISVGFCLWFSNPWWGGKWLERTATKMYPDEGFVKLDLPNRSKNMAWGLLAGSLFGLCILASVALGFAGYIPERYMQPVSALYSVPFLVFLSIRMRPVAGWIPFLWPILYALHAILAVAGVPILVERWPSLNMLIPTAGYGLLCGLVGHFYGRYAFRRLRGVARPRGTE